MEYSATKGDEVEDLLSLLAFAKERMPEIEAVSSGAIASDYQRLRVENVSPPDCSAITPAVKFAGSKLQWKTWKVLCLLSSARVRVTTAFPCFC